MNDVSTAAPVKPTWVRMLKWLPALLLIVLVVPSSASAQATRTWVSGVGDDANPCSRTAPCKTFAGSISKTANGGEINCIDPGGFGGVTITKSITIDCKSTEGGVLVSGTNAIVVNATANDKVKLRGLDINGIGTGAPTSLSGVKVLSAKQVVIADSEIYRFQSGITVVPTSLLTRVIVKGNNIHDNGVGVLTAPGNNTITAVATTMRHNDVDDNTCGVSVSSFGANASTPVAATDCGAAGAGSGINKTAVVNSFDNGFTANGTAMFARGSLGAIAMAWTHVIGNTIGLRRIDSAVIRTFTPATNVVTDNGSSDAPNATTPMVRPQVR